MEIILGIDVGSSRIGVAQVAGPKGVPTPLTIIEAKGKAAERALIDLIAFHSVKTVICGLPLDESGAETSECERVYSFLRRILKRCSARVLLVDEYFSSYEARERSSRKQERGSPPPIDDLAAVIILERYLGGAPTIPFSGMPSEQEIQRESGEGGAGSDTP